MVKHQRRSHQRGIHSSELDDGETSDSDSGESPSTPQHSSQMQWPQQIPAHVMPHGHQMHRAHSFADFGHHQIEGYGIQQAYGHRHSISSGAAQFTTSMLEQGHQNPMLHRAPSLPAHSSYYVPEQNNPGVATLNTNPTPIQTYQIPRQMERQEVIHSSPSSYSSASRASPVSQEQFYTHHPAQAATYALQNSSPIEQQPMIQYQQQLPQHLSQQHAQPIPTPVSQPPHVQEQFHATAPQEGQWYDNVAYQAPVEVISHAQGYPHAHVFHDPWATKLESYDDLSLQMPSARIENL
jgi:hypothetical protein